MRDLAKFWDEHISDKKGWIRGYGEGVGTLSRNWLLTVVEDGESLLDVGSGPGCTYENLKVHDRQVRYRGLDFCQGFVDACLEMFPEADFQVGDAMSLDEEDGTWDNVLLRHVLSHTPEYQAPIREALRVAKRRVVIVMWRPLLEDNKPDHIGVWTGRGSNDYNGNEFRTHLRSFKLPFEYREFGGQRPNWAWVLYKIQDDCVFDLDDFCNEGFDGRGSRFELLLGLKEQYPSLKVTLFTIPGKSTPSFLREIASLDWIELAVHGYSHVPNTECREWSHAYTRGILDEVESWGCFVKGFKAPGWVITPTVCEVLKERGYWLMHHLWQGGIGDVELPIYRTFHPWMLHGHMQNVHTGEENGLRQLINHSLPWDQDTKFHFVSEMVV